MSESGARGDTGGGPTWRRCAWFVLATMGAGVVMAGLLARVWFAPPLLPYTPLVSLLAVCAWIPALLVCVLRRPGGRRLIALGLVLAGLFTCLIGMTLVGPSAGLLLPGVYSGPLTCEQENTVAGLVHHTCVRPDLMGAEEIILEGEAGWPFVRLVEVRRIE